MNTLSELEGGLLLGAIASYFVAMLLLWLQLFFRAGEPVEHVRPWQAVLQQGSRLLLWMGAAFHGLALLGQGRTLWSDCLAGL
jgi:hypothetical protein